MRITSTSGLMSPYQRTRPHGVGRVWGSRAFVFDTSADKLSARAIPCVFLGYVLDAPGWQFYHPTSRRIFPSQDVTFDESVPFYHLFPYHSAPPPPPPLFLASGHPPVDPLPPQGPAPSGVSQVDPLPSRAPVEVAVGSGAAQGAASGGAASGGEEPGGVEPEGVEPGGADSEGVESGGAEPRGASLCGAGGAGVIAEAGGTGAPTASGPGGARTGGTGAARTGGVGGARAGDPTEPGAARAGGCCASSTGAGDAGAGGAGVGGTGAHSPHYLLLLVTQSNPADLSSVMSLRLVLSRLFILLVAILVHVLLLSPARTLRHSVLPLFHCVFLCLLLLSPLFLRSLTESDRARAASPTVSCLLATAVNDPSFESAAASSLIAELLDFAAACRLDYTIALVASPPSVAGEYALRTDVVEDRQEDFKYLAAAVPRFASMLLAPEGDPDAPDIPTPRSYAEAITGPYSSQWQAAMDAKMASWKSTGTYVVEVPPPGANIDDGMWIFRVKRPPGSPPAFKARYVARGFSQGQGVDYFHTFSPTPKMTTLRVLLRVAAQRDYESHSLDFSIAFLQGNLHEEIWLRRPPGFTMSFPAGTQWSLRRPVYGLCQAPREWHDTLRTTLAALGFAPATADPSLFQRTDTSLPPLYVLVYVDNLVFATADTEALTHVKSELQKKHTCTDLGEPRSYLGL
ncbi:unnamed protein product [Closterium sp. NIES-54]